MVKPTREQLIECFDCVFASIHSDGFKMDRLVDVLAETFTRMSRTDGIAAWIDGKTGLKMPRFVNGGWHRLNSELLKVAEDFMIADAVSQAGSPVSGMNMKDCVKKLAPHPPLMERWAVEHMIKETVTHQRFYFDDPMEYGKIHVALHKATFNGMYPRIMVMLWSNEYIKSDDMFWLAYSLVTNCRTKIKAKVDMNAYVLMKMYINASIGFMFNDSIKYGMSAYNPWQAMTVCYAHYVMSELLLTLDPMKVVYADVDEMYADVSLAEMQTALAKIECGIPCEIEYVSEMKVHARKSYTIKTSSDEWKRYGIIKNKA